MSNNRDLSAGVCVIGRSDFHTGLGTVTAAALELFARNVPVSLYPAREGPSNLGNSVTLPSGRVVPIVDRLDGFSVFLFTDVLWNGMSDYRYKEVPESGFRIAHMAYDSDQLPPEWVTILNSRFDLALFTSSHLEQVAVESGVRIPVGTLPIGLDIEKLIARRYVAPRPSRIRFGTVSAFHDRKGLDVLVEGFLREFGADEDVELVLHSNLASGDTFARVKAMIDSATSSRIFLSHGNLSNKEKDDLIDSFDVYVSVSAGEGYSIGPREALALGKPLVLSDIPPHRDLAGPPGVEYIESCGRTPARYTEIDNRVFGMRQVFDPRTVGRALRVARDFALSDAAPATAGERKARAAEFSLTRLEPDYRRLIDPDAPYCVRIPAGSSYTRIPTEGVTLARNAGGRHGSRIGKRKIVVQAHDGGFFSLFNVFVSNLVWSAQESSPPLVLPDWDAGRLLERTGGSVVSYCYSKPEDGNMWLGLFEPLYDLSFDEMTDPEFLYHNADVPPTQWNEHKEPLLTYSNAFELYHAPWFGRFRKQYSTVVRDRIRLIPEYQSQVDAFKATTSDLYMIAAHVKHPSHAIEQPNGVMAGPSRYVAEVRAALARKGIRESSDDWGVFLATDQERVVDMFEQEFGDRIVRFEDVSRVSVEADTRFDELALEERARDGHQLQHMMAADRSAWSIRLAWEVWRDAEAMASSDVLIHAVSNVATAVSYLGEVVNMVYCNPYETGMAPA